MFRLTVLLIALLLVAASCSVSGPAAIVNGIPIENERLEELHDPPGSISDAERASSLFLLILHQLVTTGAERDFGVSATGDELEAAFALRTGGPGDVDTVLADRGVTRARVMLEAELDVIRGRVEEEIVRSGSPGVDLDKAYRDFLAVNSKTCLVVLTLLDPSLAGEVESRVEAGEGLEAIHAAYPDRTVRVEPGCLSPLDHASDLASVALDGEVGRSYARKPDVGGVYVVLVTERLAPSADEVRDEVLETAIERQGPELFNLWAADLIARAEVEVSDRIGTWEPGPGTGDLPTVVAGSG